MSDDPIRREIGDGRGRYVIARDGAEAELTWTEDSPGRIVAAHTFVPVAWRGQGVAQALVARLVADARSEGTRIVPACSFVRAEARRHPEWHDVVQA